MSVTDVKDLIPLVKLQPCDHVGESVVGLLNYHGEHLPVIDVSSVVAHQHSPDAFSTRIAIVEVESEPEFESGPEEEISAGAQLSGSRLHGTSLFRLGLILDQVYETAELTQDVNTSLQEFAQSPFIRAMLKDSQGMVVQQLAIAPLLSKINQNRLRAA